MDSLPGAPCTRGATCQWQAFHSLAENLPDNVVRYDAAGRIVYVNPSMCRTLGRSADELLGRGLDGMVMAGTEWAPRYRRIIMQGTATGAPEELRINVRIVSGEEQIHLLRMVSERDSEGRLTGTLVIGRDITELDRAMAQLQIRAEEFRALVENSPDTIARYDLQGRRVYINSAGGGLLGCEAAEAADRSPSSFGFTNILRGVLQRGRMFEGEVPYVTVSGEQRWDSLRVVPEFGPDGKVASALAVGHDITLRKQMEQHLAASRAELRELAARRETAREEERKRLARELHDELGQALMALRLEIKVAERQGSRPGGGEGSARILGLIEKTGHVIKRVVSALRPAALDGGLGPAMEWLASDFTERTGLACVVDLADRGRELDEERALALFRILQESLTNIARHASATRVLIRLERTGLDFRLSVRDDGVGFDPTALATKSFGLVGMRERALAVGGTLAVSTAPGAGTDVVVLLPVRRGR